MVVTTTLFSQEENTLIGKWQLQEISYKGSKIDATSNRETALKIFNEALYNQLTAAERLSLEALEQSKEEAENLLNLYFQTSIEFKANGAFYSNAQLSSNSLSGEYLQHRKKLLMEWETGDKSNFKIVKNTSGNLVLKDTDLNISYHYLRL